MRATLEFDLDEPTDRQAHMRCTKALDMACALFTMGEWLRNRTKLSGDESTNLIYEKFISELEDKGINLEDMLT